MKGTVSLLFVLCVLALSERTIAQPGTTAVPFLLLSTSTEANGMGGIMSSVVPTNSSAMLFNPAQAGMLSQSETFSSNFFTHKTLWLPRSPLSDIITLNNYSFLYGFRNKDFLPSNISLGIGYSRVYLNLGKFAVTSPTPPTVLSTYNAFETSDNVTIGVGMDVGIRLATGVTLKWINSHLTAPGTLIQQGAANGKITAADFGIFAQFPISNIILEKHTNDSFTPFWNINLSYALNNYGDEISYIDALQSDPLPREARIGWSTDLGFDIQMNAKKFNLFTVQIAREAEDILATRNPNGSIGAYQGPLGDINLYHSLILSRYAAYVDVRRGGSISFLEMVTLRQGSFDGSGNLNYKTSGYTVSSKGLFRIASLLLNNNSYVTYFLDHFELRLSRSEYHDHLILGNITFSDMSISFHP